MHAYSLSNKNEVDSSIAAEATDAQMVGRMRLVLAISAFLAIFIDRSALGGAAGYIWLVFSGYIGHSFVVYVYSQLNQPFAQSRLIHWLDVVWYALMVLFTDATPSFFFSCSSSLQFSPRLFGGASKKARELPWLRSHCSPPAVWQRRPKMTWLACCYEQHS